MFEVESYGRGDDVVLLHGSPVPPTTMDLFVEALSGEFRVLVPDMVANGLEAAEALRVLTASLREHDVERAAFVGHSFGALQSFQMALRGEIEVTRIVSLGGLVYYPEEVRAGYEEIVPGVKSGEIDLAELMTGGWFSEGYLAEHPGTVDMLREWFAPLSAQDIADVVQIQLVTPDLREELPQLDIPVYLRVGSADEATPVEWSQEIHGLLPNSTLDVVEGAGHFLQIENPRETSRAVRDFLVRSPDADA